MPTKGNSPVALRVDDETRARWSKAAEDRGLTLTDFVRAMVEAGLEGTRTAPALPPRPKPKAASATRACHAHAGSGKCEHRVSKGSFCRVSGSVVQ